MNLPNKLTLFRVILIPFFVVCLYLSEATWNEGWLYGSLIIFIVASLTDLFDGKIARKYNLVTNFGKFMDPLADKLLVSAALICFEFIISGFRLVASDSGVVIAASMWGKVKTTFQMVMIVLLLLPWCFMIGSIDLFFVLQEFFKWGSLLLTIISLIDYLYKNKGVMLEGGM